MKILAVSSIGGHLIQLLRLYPSLDKFEIEFVTTNPNFKSTVNGAKFYSISDGNRSNLTGLLKGFLSLIFIIIRSNPDVILTTGAAPGLLAVLVGKVFLVKTIWIDSIANCDKVSMSCKIVSYFSDKTYTQWSHLETSRIKYKGNILK